MDFVFIANAWGVGADNPTSKHQIALELARAGHRVLWMEGAGMRRPRFASHRDRSRILRRIGAACRGARPLTLGAERETIRREGGGIWLLSPLSLPLPSRGWARCLNGWIYRRGGAAAARRLGFGSPVLVNYVPVLGEAMRRWPGAVLYHCVDRWDAFAMYDAGVMSRMDERCCRYADVVVASSQDLFERCRGRNPNTHLVTHGVDRLHFARSLSPQSRPADLPGGPVVGFFGLLSEWIDQELIRTLARELRSEPGASRPGSSASVVLIGPADVDVALLRQEPNVVLLGRRPFAELPRYIAHFDVGVIPFRVNELTRAVNPIKLREMLAAGCPVVSTALPEVARCANMAGTGKTGPAVVVAATHDEFIRAVVRRVRDPFSPDERRAVSAGMSGETWEAKVGEILSVIGPVAQAGGAAGRGGGRDAESVHVV